MILHKRTICARHATARAQLIMVRESGTVGRCYDTVHVDLTVSYKASSMVQRALEASSGCLQSACAAVLVRVKLVTRQKQIRNVYSH